MQPISIAFLAIAAVGAIAALVGFAADIAGNPDIVEHPLPSAGGCSRVALIITVLSIVAVLGIAAKIGAQRQASRGMSYSSWQQPSSSIDDLLHDLLGW